MKHQTNMTILIGLVYVLCSLMLVMAQDQSAQLIFSNGTIYGVDVASGAVTTLSNRDGYATEPRWSPDGNQIAYTTVLTDDYYGQYGLYIMDADGSHPKLIAGDLVWRTRPVWIEAGAALLYATSTEYKGGSCIIKQVNVDGSGARELYHQDRQHCTVSNLNPVLSPDGRQIVFGLDAADDGQYFQLYGLTLADGHVTQLTDNRANNSAPAWSPDGRQIAYVSDQDKQREIYLMNADGSQSRRVTHRPGNDYAPQWLADGKQLIFASDQHGYNLWRLDLANGGVHNLTQLVDSSAWGAALSPDGTHMAYLVGIDPVAGSDHIAVMTLADGAVQEFKNAGVNGYALAWRP